jgi:hypothetical protein
MDTMTDDIRVMTSGAFTAAYLELIPRLELLTKKKLVTAATSIGTGETSIPDRLRRGEPVGDDGKSLKPETKGTLMSPGRFVHG